MSLTTYNSRYKSIPPEKFCPRIWYAITLNAKDLEGKTIEKRVFEYLSILAKLKYCTYQLWFELSQTGKLHLHGKIKVINKTDVAKFFAYDMCVLTTDTAFEIDTIDMETNGKYDDGFPIPMKRLGKSSEETILEPEGEDGPNDGPEKADEGKWTEYCQKGKHYMKPFLEEYKLPWRVTNMMVDSVINNKHTPQLKTFFSMA